LRNIWRGAISFGLVNVPIKLYTAIEDRNIHFSLLHSACQTPIKYHQRCPNCEKDLNKEEIIRGYEYEKGRFVIIQDEDLEGIAAEKSKTIDIIDFVNLAEIDPIYFHRSYFLAPAEGGQKAYALLRQAMENTSRIAIARVVIRAKESLAAIRVYKQGLIMETIYYPEEIRSIELVPELQTEVSLKEKELDMAESLIASLTTQFEPEKYTNEYRQAVRELIEAKVQGQEIVRPVQPQTGNVVDLMEALQASIELAKAKNSKTAKADQAESSPKAKRPKAVPDIPGSLDQSDLPDPKRKRKSKNLAAK
jgi:DNA end-binding protein Ku